MNTNNKSISVLAITTLLLTAIGLAVIPSLVEQVQAANLVSESKNKGQQGDKSSDSKRQGHGGSGGGGGCDSCG